MKRAEKLPVTLCCFCRGQLFEGKLKRGSRAAVLPVMLFHWRREKSLWRRTVHAKMSHKAVKPFFRLHSDLKVHSVTFERLCWQVMGLGTNVHAFNMFILFFNTMSLCVSCSAWDFQPGITAAWNLTFQAFDKLPLFIFKTFKSSLRHLLHTKLQNVRRSTTCSALLLQNENRNCSKKE